MKVYVVGSSNTDMVVKTPTLPRPGETIIGGNFLMNPGGKGANQAVAAARMAGKVVFIGCVGDDQFGKNTLKQLAEENIDTSNVIIDKSTPSGVALITVDNNGENCIAVAGGANNNLSPYHLDTPLFDLTADDILLTQLESPLKTVQKAIELAFQSHTKTILNPAPAQILPDTIYPLLFAITPNETEAEVLTGIAISDESSAHLAAENLYKKGCSNVVITLGSKGAYLYSEDFKGIISSQKTEAIDSTAAGDCFNGALAVAIGEGKSLVDAIEFANKAAAISVTRMGAQSSIPRRNEEPSLN